jgi:hypothetical protein
MITVIRDRWMDTSEKAVVSGLTNMANGHAVILTEVRLGNRHCCYLYINTAKFPDPSATETPKKKKRSQRKKR